MLPHYTGKADHQLRGARSALLCPHASAESSPCCMLPALPGASPATPHAKSCSSNSEHLLQAALLNPDLALSRSVCVGLAYLPRGHPVPLCTPHTPRGTSRAGLALAHRGPPKAWHAQLWGQPRTPTCRSVSKGGTARVSRGKADVEPEPPPRQRGCDESQDAPLFCEVEGGTLPCSLTPDAPWRSLPDGHSHTVHHCGTNHSTEAPLSPRSPGTKSAATTFLQTVVCQWPRPAQNGMLGTRDHGGARSRGHSSQRNAGARAAPLSLPSSGTKGSLHRTPRQEVLACPGAGPVPTSRRWPEN